MQRYFPLVLSCHSCGFKGSLLSFGLQLCVIGFELFADRKSEDGFFLSDVVENEFGHVFYEVLLFIEVYIIVPIKRVFLILVHR